MKNNFKTLLFGAMAAVLATGCVSDDDYQIPPFNEVVFSEDFETAEDGTILNLEDWVNFAETGTRQWREERFPLPAGNGYTEFSPFGSGESSNIGWLITPGINITDAEKVLSFQSAQHHLESDANTLEVLISTDFEGDVLTATWEPLEPAVAGQEDDWYDFVNSGSIDLSDYSGTVYIAFKVTGDGNALTAGYQLDNVKIY